MNATSLYIHIPFCSRKCLFCSFVIAVGQEHRREEYVAALIGQIGETFPTTLKTIYLGGGTPSMLNEDHLEGLMSAIIKKYPLLQGIEITIEANPESIDRAKAKFLKALGFTRISLGVQSLDERYLKFLGRTHDALMAREAYGILREEGFVNVNVDLMYGFPGQTMEELQEDVHAIASLGSEHLSLYNLTIEKNSRFFAAGMELDDGDYQAKQYVFIGRALCERGFEQYEISNFSKPGFKSAHNINYWQGGPYLGLGIGAHGFDGRRRYWNISNLQEYIKKAARKEETVEGFEILSDEQLVMEKVLFGLRMNEGIPEAMVPLNRRPLIQAWTKDGFLCSKDGKLKATTKGRLVLDELSARLI